MKSSFGSITAVAAILLFPFVHGHVEMISPPALNSKDNPHSVESQIDYSMTSPLDASGSDFPCKGFLAAGKANQDSVATWQAGSSQTVKLSGSAIHGGGSCQLSFSEDGGSTFRVVKSFEGNCPASTDATLDFDVPKEVKSGNTTFAWTWFNFEGNLEMYMNCASVTIENGGSGLDSSFPEIFVANIGNGCESRDASSNGNLAFPDPGSVVDKSGSSFNDPVGNCGSSSSGSSGSGAASAGTAASTAAATTAAAETSAAVTIATIATSDAKAPATTGASSPTTTEAAGAAGTAATSAVQATGAASETAAAPVASSTAGASGSGSSSGSSNTTTGTESCTTEGKITCNSDGTWSMCGSGLNQLMGSVPAGMMCSDGAIVAKTSKRSIRLPPQHRRRAHFYPVKRM